MFEILRTLQEILMNGIAPMQLLSANAAIGDTIISVANSSRYRIGDEAMIVSDTVTLPGQAIAGAVEICKVKSIPDYNQIELSVPLTRAWLLSEGAYIVGTVDHMPLQRVYIGKMPVNAKFPCITISPVSEDNDWMTLQATNHEYKFDIGVYVLTDTLEKSTILCGKFAKKAREVLMDQIHPVVNGISYPLSADLPPGSKIVTLPTTVGITIPALAFIRDAKTRIPARESVVRAILSPTEVEIVIPTEYEYLMARGAEFILMKRYLYDTRPSNIRYGFVKKEAGMLAGANISWYAKEELIRPGNILT
jgi:hypothetical protein